MGQKYFVQKIKQEHVGKSGLFISFISRFKIIVNLTIKKPTTTQSKVQSVCTWRHLAAIFVSQNNEKADMLVDQTNPVGVQLFSYVNTFFCHVGVPNQSCESSTLFLCKHFLLFQ